MLQTLLDHPDATARQRGLLDDAKAGSPATAAEGKAWIGTLTGIDAAAGRSGDTATQLRPLVP